MPNHRGIFSFDLKSVSDSGRITGLAAVFGNIDRQNDVIERGAFVEILKNAEGRVPVLWQHDIRAPVGVASVAQNDKGLAFDGQLVMDDPQARVALAHVKAGSTRGMSIGFDILKDEIRAGIRYLKELRLYEISLVVFGANPLAYVAAKSIEDCEAIGDWEAVLRQHGISKRKARRMAVKDWAILTGADADDDDAVKDFAGEIADLNQFISDFSRRFS